jgi:hypothetical protein
VPEELEEARRQHHEAIALAFALADADHQALTLNIGDLERTELGHPQARGVEGGEHRTVLQVAWGRDPVETNSLPCILVGVVFVAILLITPPPFFSRMGLSQRYKGVLGKSRQSEEINFALKEGETLVGVMDTTRAMCFHIGNDVRESKDYEEEVLL